MEFIEVFSEEGYGQHGSFGIKILLNKTELNLKDIENESLKQIRYSIMEAAKSIKSKIMEYRISQDKESQENSKKDKEDILNLFPILVFVEEIPNGYCSDWCCKHKPWFIVTTLKGRIKIGWRKRVLNIDWSDSIIIQTADGLFPDEDVTKIDKSIHAWGYDKAAEYITKLLSI